MPWNVFVFSTSQLFAVNKKTDIRRTIQRIHFDSVGHDYFTTLESRLNEVRCHFPSSLTLLVE